MDLATHAFASYSLGRATFPRLSLLSQFLLVAAGTAADLDAASYSFGPSACLRFDRTVAHSLIIAPAIAMVCTLIAARVSHRSRTSSSPPSFRLLFIAMLCAALLHLALDVCQAQPVFLLWPFSRLPLHLGLLAGFDLWLLAILAAGAVLPLLTGLVSQEIGARAKAPRGRTGATLVLAVIFLYIGGRAFWHRQAVSLLDSRSYHGESPRHIAAFPYSTSPFRWHGIVETTSALHALDLTVGPANQFDPESATSSFKPEPSPALDAALRTPSARLLLSRARFPKASIEKTADGFQVTIRDSAYTSAALSGRFPIAIVDTDPASVVQSQSLVWPRKQ